MFLPFLVLLFSNIAQAELKFEARVEPEVVGIGQPFSLLVSVSSNGDSLNVADPQLPQIPNLSLLGQRQESQSIRRFEGGQFKTIQSRLYVFTYVAMAPGAYSISPIRMRVNGGEKNLSSTPFHVSDSAPQGPGTPPPGEDQDQFFPPDDDGLQQMDRMEEMFNQMLRRNGDPRLQRPAPGGEADPQGFFIQVELDKTKAYVGEHINASWYLYTRGQVRDIDTLKYPDLAGFWKEDIEVATRLNFEQVNVNGAPYNRALLVSFALYPLKPGTAIIDPYTAKCTIISMDGLNLFGLAKPQVLTRSSPQIKIEVLPVPETNRPPDFSGGTGIFNMFASIDASSFKTNTPFFYRLKFEGRGNAKIIELPKIESAEGLELYDKKSSTGFEKNGTSRKEFELTFIPRKAGEITIPKITLSFFNPQTKTFYRKETEVIPINVELTKDDPGVAPQKMDHKDDEAPTTTLPQLAEFREPVAWGNYFNRYTWFFGYGLSVLMLLGKAGRELGWWEKKVTLEGKFRARVKGIHDLIGKGDWRRVGQEMINTIYFVLGEITGLGGASYEMERLLAEAPPSIRTELGDQIKKLLEEAEILGFAPEAAVGVRKDKANLKRLVAEMEKILGRGITRYAVPNPEI